MGLPLQTWVLEKLSMNWKHIDKFLVQWLVKKVMLLICFGMKGAMTIDFLEEGASINNASYYQFLR